MAFTVAPTDNFTSYLSVAGSNTFHADHGNLAWEDADAVDDKQPALVRATTYLNASYVPLSDFIVDDVVDPAVEAATALLALYALTEDLFGIRDDRDITETSSSLEGVGSESIKYRVGRNDRYPMVTAILSGIAAPRSSGVVVGRAIR